MRDTLPIVGVSHADGIPRDEPVVIELGEAIGVSFGPDPATAAAARK
ncbi:hypothetical protein [Terrabacter sp. BE26]